MGWYDRITTSKSASRWDSDETGDSLDRGWSPSKSVSNFFGDSSTVHTTDKNKYSQILS